MPVQIYFRNLVIIINHCQSKICLLTENVLTKLLDFVF